MIILGSQLKTCPNCFGSSPVACRMCKHCQSIFPVKLLVDETNSVRKNPLNLWKQIRKKVCCVRMYVCNIKKRLVICIANTCIMA